MIGMLRRAFGDYARYRFLYGICLFTIALSVFIVGAFALFFVNAGDLMRQWQKGIRITAYLGPNVSAQQASALAQEVSRYPGVAGVSYIPKEEGLAWLKNQIKDRSSLLEGLEENPLPDALEVRPAGNMENVEDLGRLAGKIAAQPGVAEVAYARNWLRRFYGIYSLFQVTAAVMVTLIFMAIMFILANTIRLILYSRREEIEITRIIGADEAFLKYPLYLESALLGFFGGLAGLLLLYGAFVLLMPRFSPEGLLPFFRVRFIPQSWTLIILISSVFVGWLGCFFSVRRFLRV